METSHVIEKIANGEDSYTQFKLRAVRAKDLAKEMVAFANAEGGIIIFGIADNGDIKGLNQTEIEEIGQLVGNCANENVRPPIHPLTENKLIDEKKVTVVTISKGANKPYATSSGDYYVKSGPDKKKISQEELRRLFAESQHLFADEEIIYKSSINDINTELFFNFFKHKYKKEFNAKQMELYQVLENLNLMENQHLTLAGNLFFGRYPQKFSPMFKVQCVYFDGNDISATTYRSKKDFEGTLGHLFEQTMTFLSSSLVSIQTEKEFNTPGMLEISEEALSELVVNALVHRDYFICSSIKVFIFNERVEIISPGKLPNSLTIERIKNGISIARNPIINSLSQYVLPYSGLGSGISRALNLYADIDFINNIEQEEFKCIIKRQKKRSRLSLVGSH